MQGEGSEDFNSTPDILIATVLILCFIVGLAGNISALAYFLSKKLKTIPDKLYIIVISADIGTCTAPIPVVLSLLNNRDPVLFANSFVCGVISVVVIFLIRVSMFLVAVMSVTRSFAIIIPHRARSVCTMKRIIAVIVGYSFILLFIDGVLFASGWMKAIYYRKLRSYCSYKLTEKSPEWAKIMVEIAVEIEFFIPSVVVFVSFLAGTITLASNAAAQECTEVKTPTKEEKRISKSKSRLSIFSISEVKTSTKEEKRCSTSKSRFSTSSTSDVKKSTKEERRISKPMTRLSISSTVDAKKISRQVSVTITLFTALFLICNIPLFVYQFIYFLSKHVTTVKIIVDSAAVNQKFAHLLCLVLPYVLNAALNPCLYLLRMPRYRTEFMSWGCRLQQGLCELFQ